MEITPPLPASLLEWPPWIWSRRLFAGRTPILNCPVSRINLLVVLILPAILIYPHLNFALLEPDESRYAEIPREMLLRGDLITPVLEGEPYLDKPPLLYWLIAASYSVFGVSAWSARLVPAISLHLTIITLFFLGRRLLGQAAALMGAVLLCLSPAFISMGRLLLIDSLLTLWVTVSLLAGLESIQGEKMRRGWWFLTAIACGLGVLTKGPIAVVLLVPPLVLQYWLANQRCRITIFDYIQFALIVAALNIPWYLTLSFKIPEFLWIFIWEHHVLRYFSAYAHEQGVWFYAPVLLFGLFPGSLLLGPLCKLLVSGKKEDTVCRPSQLGFCLLAGGWCFLFFSLSTCKLPTYIMPAIPFFCLAFGWMFTQSPSIRGSFWPKITAIAMLTGLLIANHWGLPWYAEYRNPFDPEGKVQQLCSNPSIPVVCYPRDCNSVGFYLRRTDIQTFRSKDIEDLRDLVRNHPQVVVLCTHRNSFEGLVQLLPPEVHVVHRLYRGLSDIPGVPGRWMKSVRDFLGRTALGLGDIAVVERWDKNSFPGGEELAEPPQRIKSRVPGAGSHKN